MTLFREFRNIFSWMYEYKSWIDPSIVVHAIITCPDSNSVRQKLHQVNPQKEVAIKEQVEKIIRARFIYLVLLTKLVSNIVPMNKKHGTIRVCINF